MTNENSNQQMRNRNSGTPADPPAFLPEKTGPDLFTRAEMRAGLFVLSALTVLGFFYFFGKDVASMLQPHKRLVALFNDVSGLEAGTIVKFAGLDIGKVTDLRIVETESNRMEVDLRVLDLVPLRQGTVASIRATELVIGKYIDLSGGPIDAPLLQDGAVILGSQEPTVDEVVNSAGRIVLNIGDIVDQLSRIFKEQNVDKFVSNLNRLVESVADPDHNILPDLKATLGSLVESGAVDDIIAITNTLARNRQKIISLVDQANRLAEESNLFVEIHGDELSALVSELNRIAGAFSKDSEPLARDLTQLAGNAVAIAEDLPSLIKTTENILSRLDQTLTSLNKILARTENIKEEDLRRFLQHEGVRIYLRDKDAPELEIE